MRTPLDNTASTMDDVMLHRYIGAASCLADFEAHLQIYEENTKSKFVVLKSDKAFGKTEFNVAGKAVHWQLKTVPYDGMPFAVVGTKTFVCHHGRDKHAACKRKREEKMAKHQKEDQGLAETVPMIVTTKKTGCPAVIYALHVCKFPDYKIQEDTPYQRREKSRAVRKALRGDPLNVGTEQMFIAYFPHVTEHKNHPILRKINEDTPYQRRKRSAAVRRALRGDLSHVGKKQRTSALFIAEHKKHHFIGKDLLESWMQEGYAIEYRPYQEKDDGTVEKLLLCLQTPWQRRLLVLYGQQMCLLDATYRRSRYPVPLFFLCVRTNVNYIVVGVFVTQSEKKEDIRGALEVFKRWNADWNPSHFMVDFCETEIGALEEAFPDSKVILSDFHREKAWTEWTKKKAHGVTCDEDVLKMLRDIADSGTTEEFESSTLVLKQHTAWQTNERLRRWFSTKWLGQAERWVNAFKKEDLRVAVYANNGVERQNETLKQSYLKGFKNCSLSDTITVIVQDFLPKSYQRYIESNAKCSSGYGAYSQNVPPHLRDKPRIVADHIMTRHQESLMFTEDQVTPAGEVSFTVNAHSRTTPQQYVVSFGSESQMPSCTCADWQKNLLPCMHFCAVFNLVRGWSWDSLCLAYRENPLFVLDEGCLGDTPVPTYAGGLATKPSSSSYTVVTSPKTKAWRRQKCGNLLQELADKAYQLQDDSYLDSVIEKLEDLLEDVGQHTPHAGPLALSYTPPVKRKRSEATEQLRPLKKRAKKLQ